MDSSGRQRSGRRHSAGGVVLGDGGSIVLVRAREGDGAFLFPKGQIEPSETPEEAARREIGEEAGLHMLKLLDDLGSYERFGVNKDGSYNTSLTIEIRMFLFAAPQGAIPSPSMEMDAAKWVPLKEAMAVIGNEKDREWFASVFDRVVGAMRPN